MKHKWMTRLETKDADMEDEYRNEIDWFALNEGLNNGPRCSVCGFSFCIHCSPEDWDSECKGLSNG